MITTLQVEEKVKHKLDRLKVHHRETYNELLARMIKMCSSEISRESLVETVEVLSEPETMREIAEALEEYKFKRGKTLEQIEKELGL